MAIIHCANAMHLSQFIEPESVQCVVTSPPYFGLRDYGVEGQIGLETTPEEYVDKLVRVFREVWKVLRPDGTVWLNLGDSYWGAGGANNNSGITGRRPEEGADKDERDNPVAYRARWGRHGALKPKDLCMIPARVALALQADGWYLRSAIVWAKGMSFCPDYSGSVMPESVRDRPTSAYEMVYLLTKSERYFYDADAVAEPSLTQDPRRPYTSQGAKQLDGRTVWHSGELRKGTNFSKRNLRNVWAINPKPYPGAHFATFPERLVEPCILAGTSPYACPECGEPWIRVIERAPMVINRSDRRKQLGRFGRTAPSGTMVSPARSETVGWEATCPCPDNGGSGKCVVLDPFAGSGTTLLVAERFGRRGVGIELNPQYVEMAQRRLGKVQLEMWV